MVAGVRIVIEVKEGGQITVTGPLHDKVACYGLLGVATDIVRAHEATQRVVPAPPMWRPPVT